MRKYNKSNIERYIFHFRKYNKKGLILLIDPDKFNFRIFSKTIHKIHLDFIFVGGSLLSKNNFHQTILKIKKITNIPVIIFPGNNYQISDKADALLFLSLISGRNPEYLIGQHVIAAPLLKETSLEIIPTGYMLIGFGNYTSSLYMSNTQPIPHDKKDIALCTALAGEMLGLKIIYLDGGSGATYTVPPEMIRYIRKNINVPLIVGGGIRNAKTAKEILMAGADLIVIGNAFEENPDMITEFSEMIKTF